MAFIKKWLFRIFLLVVFVVAMLAASENSELVTLKFVDWQTWEWPVSYWMLCAFGLGLAFGILLNMVTNAKLRLASRTLTKAVQQSNKELDKARATSPLPAE